MLLRSRTGRGRDGVGVWGSGDEYKGVEQVETGGAELARELREGLSASRARPVAECASDASILFGRRGEKCVIFGAVDFRGAHKGGWRWIQT